MAPGQLLLELLVFSLAWWLGLYLFNRDLSDPRLRYAGLGLITYALGLAAGLLSQVAETPELSQSFVRWGWPLLFLPALFWFGATFFLLPEEVPLRQRFGRFVAVVLLPLAAILYLLGALTEIVVVVTLDGPEPGAGYWLLAGTVFVLLLASFLLVLSALRRDRARTPVILAFVATLFFGLGAGLLLFPLDIFPRTLVVVAISFDLILLGLAIALLDALDLGQSLWPDFSRAFIYSFAAAAVFGGQVALVMALSTGLNLAMVVLLLATVATAMVILTFSDSIQSAIDGQVFSHYPRAHRERVELRAAAGAASRASEVVDTTAIDEAEFNNLTRRALSYMGNLPRLAASPLTRMPIIEDRLSHRRAMDNTLERAAELKAVLAESIERLKPRGQDAYGTTDEWRYYNSLYYPYMAGLKPYSRRADYNDLDAPAGEVLVWFQSQVPERTLHNWQKAAAILVAQDLREQMGIGNVSAQDAKPAKIR